MADELERARKREAKLVAVFSAIDARDDAQIALGDALVELRDLGVAQADLAEMTGLSAREVGAAIRAAKDNTTDTDDTVNDAADSDTTAAGQTPADTNGEQQP
ncbi:hypothetical protein G6030_01030 [Dietzia sp. E1]|uniref:hypothetical protein n=1 Tax=unclassified Dietzia TaxID=2617939 RepID=UPI0015FC5C50|nr:MULTISPECIES: hypothetical protein [unclassified Dietzia]MBB1019903.1 hypothetical protein [Dietzia sp. E1]